MMAPTLPFPEEGQCRLGQLRLCMFWYSVGCRTDGLELSLKLYHVCDLRLGHQQSVTEAPPTSVRRGQCPRARLRKVVVRDEADGDDDFRRESCSSTIAFSLEIKGLGIAAPAFKELFVSSLLSNLTIV
jgi:hypothetical protein